MNKAVIPNPNEMAKSQNQQDEKAEENIIKPTT